MKIRTAVLKSLMNKITKGASNDSLFPITSLISLALANNTLTLITTDNTNQFKANIAISEEDVKEASDFYTVVNVNTFAKLIDKTTKEFIELNVYDNYLEFKGNGIYKLDIAVDDKGEVIRFLDVDSIAFEKEYDINLKDLQDAIKTAKASTLKTKDTLLLTGYYIGNEIVATDRQLVCKINKQLIGESILLSSELANLLLLLDLDEIFECKLKINSENGLLFVTNKYIIYGIQLEGKDIFESNVIGAVDNLTSLAYESSVSIDKNDILSALDRLSLFINYYDDNSIKLIFDEKGVTLQSLQTNATEFVNFKEVEKCVPFECFINVNMLKSQLKSLVFDNVNLLYGGQKSIQINENYVSLVIALLNNIQ